MIHRIWRLSETSDHNNLGLVCTDQGLLLGSTPLIERREYDSRNRKRFQGTSAMIEKRHRRYGNTVDEWIAGWVAELARDATGLWHIVAAGREGFGLSGPELIAFVRRSLLALFAAGAKPVMGDVTKVYHWVCLKQYGETPEDMADAIIDEWQKLGRDPDYGGVWFATPNVYEETYDEGRTRKT